MNIWREKEEVRFGNVDRSKRLTLGTIFNYFQEGAISHAADLGVGLDALEFSGEAWILSRLSLFVERRPLYGETVEISTWPRQWEKLFALRDYQIRDEKGNAVVRGRGCWLVINVEKHKPLRIQPILEPLPPNHGIDAFPAGSPGLGSRDTLTKKTERYALYSDIDYYGHLNNARYIQWIQDLTEADILTNADQYRLDINYLSEVKPGDLVELWTAPLAHTGSGEKEKSPDNNPADNNPSDYYPAEYNPADYPCRAGPGFAYEGRRPESGQAVFRAELRVNG